MYDYGQRIQIEGLDLPEMYEVHFMWNTLERAKTVIGTTCAGKSTVDIPDSALRERGILTAYIYLSDLESGKTINQITMYINPRAEPDEYTDPDDVDTFRGALETMRDYAQSAKKSSEASEDSAENAAKSEENVKKTAREIEGRTEQAKKDIDKYVQQKETKLKGETGNVFFAAFKVINGRLKMYSDPAVDKVCFRRVGSRLKYRLKI